MSKPNSDEVSADATLYPFGYKSRSRLHLNGKLEYTGMGLDGDQSIDYMQNKTLAEANINGVDLYLFESYEDNSYFYRGLVKLDGEPYYETQKDEFGKTRKVVKFSLLPLNK